jgi:hypothetical protein
MADGSLRGGGEKRDSWRGSFIVAFEGRGIMVDMWCSSCVWFVFGWRYFVDVEFRATNDGISVKLQEIPRYVGKQTSVQTTKFTFIIYQYSIYIICTSLIVTVYLNNLCSHMFVPVSS